MSATEHCSAPERNDAQSLPLALAHVRQLRCRSSLPRVRSKPRLKATSFTLLGAALGVGMVGGALGALSDSLENGTTPAQAADEPTAEPEVSQQNVDSAIEGRPTNMA